MDYLVPKMDVLIDLHSGGAVPTVDYVYALNDLELSRAFLFPTLYQGASYPGSLGTHVIEETGKPVVVAEIGGGSRSDEAYLELGIRDVMNCLRKLGSVPGEVEKAPEHLLLTKMQILRPRYGDILEPKFGAEQLGQAVAKNTLLGVTRDAQTFEVLEAFHAPFNPTHLVLVRGVLSKVHAGDYAYMLGEKATAEILPSQQEM